MRDFLQNTNIQLNEKDPSIKKIAKYRNNFTFLNEFETMTNDALHRYKINKVPKTVSERVLLQSLYIYGQVFLFKKDGAVLGLPGMPDGSGINVYGDFAAAYVYGANGYNERINLFIPGGDDSKFLEKTLNGNYTAKDGCGVMIRANANCYPFINYVIYYAQNIADSLRALDVCRANAKKPFIITCEESAINTVKQFFKKMDDNEQFIISSGIFPTDKVNISPLDTNPEYIKSISALVDQYEQKFRELCGIENMGGQMDKKGENLQTAEITSNDKYTEGKLQQEIEWINQGLKLANEKFGTEMECVPRYTIDEDKEDEKEEETETDEKEVSEND